MAVWTTPTFKLDLAKKLYEVDERLPTLALGRNVAPYLSPNERDTAISPTDTWADLAFMLDWNSTTILADEPDIWSQIATPDAKFFVGTAAVYKLVHAIAKDRFHVKDAYKWAHIDSIMHELKFVVSRTTQCNPRKFEARWSGANESLLALSRRFENASEAMKAMRFLFKHNVNEVTEIDQVGRFGLGRRVYYGWTTGKLIILKGAEELVQHRLVFTRAHLDYMVGTTMRLANTLSYYARKFARNEMAAHDAMGFVLWTVEKAATARRPYANFVARAFHKARTIRQMEVLSSVLEGAVEKEKHDFKADGLGAVIKLKEYNEWMAKFKLKDSLEMAHVYKWMPAPDYDSTSAFSIVKDYHMATRPSGADPGASSKMKALWKKVRDERKLHTVVAHRRMTGDYIEGIPLRHGHPDFQKLSEIELGPCMLYYDLGNDIVSQVKDKATVHAIKQYEKADKTRPEDKSYLLWYMAKGDSVDTVASKEAFANSSLPEENYAKVAYKAESHKPDSRLFYMLPPIQRTILGEMEGNLSRIAENYPGSLMGKNTAAREKVLASIMDVYEAPKNTSDTLEFEVFVITFDLTKFSPKSNYNVHADYHKFWATVFGVPSLESMVDIGCKGGILHTQDGLVMEYKNAGADLEGMRGRMQTMFHADMLGAACRVGVEEGVITGRSVLSLFIDDGALKVAAVGSGATAKQNVQKFLTIMQDVYAACGQDNNPAKTLVSQTGGEMLADLYLHGVKIPVGLKAAQRVYPDYENAASAITEEFEAVQAACQGSVKDGGDWFFMHAMYSEAVLKTLSRWDRDGFNSSYENELVLKLITPKALGGFGLSSLQGLVSTAAVNATAEGLGMLNTISRQIPSMARWIEKIVTEPLVIRDPLSVLRDPTRIRRAGTVLIENRLTMQVVKWLEGNSGNYATFMSKYRDEDLIAHARAVAVALLASDTVNIPLMVRAWKATPLAYVESIVGKLKRSATIIKIIGYKEVNKIRMKNRAEVNALLRRRL